jgi:prepilin-type processing-associated H-X9-DG protein
VNQSSLDDGYFAQRTRGMGRFKWSNAPASRHGNAGHFSFADGHFERWTWKESTTRNLKGTFNDGTPSQDRDLTRVMEAMYPPGTYFK